jgi:hypothetical protein
MSNTGRQRVVIEATWDATSTAPVSYTKKRLSVEGYAVDEQAVSLIDLSDATLMRVRFPATIAVTAVTLAFLDVAFADDTDFGECLDDSGAAITIASVQSYKSKSVHVKAAIASAFFVKPVFLAAGGAPTAPGAITVQFLLKE